MFEDQKKTFSSTPVPTLDNVGTGLDIPKSAQKLSSLPAAMIHVLPKEYYGVAPKTAVKKAVAPVQSKPLPPPPRKPALPAVATVQKKKRRVPIIFIIGILFVTVIAVGGYLFLRSTRRPPVPTFPTPETEPMPEPEPPLPPSISEPEPIRPGIDTDSDGLTDVEERTIYGSDPRNPDTDADSFIDGNEVLHLYDPSRAGTATFSEQAAGPVTAYADSGFEFTFFLPDSWAAIPSGTPPAPPGTVNISIVGGETLRLRTYALDADESLEARAERLFPTNTFLPGRSKQGYDLLRSATQRIAIIAFGNQFVTVEYDIGTKRTIDYLRTFEMVVNSIKPLP